MRHCLIALPIWAHWNMWLIKSCFARVTYKKESWFSEVCYRRSTLACWLGDKIADLLEYFLGSDSKFSSTFHNKWLKVRDIHGLIRLKVFKIFVSSLVLAAWSGIFAAWAQYDSAAGVTMVKSITPHLPSLPAWRSKWHINQHEIAASCFLGFRLDTSDMDGAGAV